MQRRYPLTLVCQATAPRAWASTPPRALRRPLLRSPSPFRRPRRDASHEAMAVRLYAMNGGWQNGPLGIFLGGEHGRIRLPTPCYLVELARGTVLFDSAMHLDCQTDPAARLGILAQF